MLGSHEAYILYQAPATRVLVLRWQLLSDILEQVGNPFT